MFIQLNNFQKAVERLKSKAFFEPPVSKKEIEDLEKILEAPLPDIFKNLYLTYNGGFFADSYWTITDLQDEEKMDLIRWNSNHFLTISEIAEIFSHVNIYRSIDPDTYKKVIFIPLVQTKFQEYVVFKISEDDLSFPVFKVVSQTSPEYWEKLTESLSEFIELFTSTEGDIIPE